MTAILPSVITAVEISRYFQKLFIQLTAGSPIRLTPSCFIIESRSHEESPHSFISHLFSHDEPIKVACTGLVVQDGERVLLGNNEDGVNPCIKSGLSRWAMIATAVSISVPTVYCPRAA